MIRINLLPVKEAEVALWRRQQLSFVALVVSVAVLLMVVGYAYQRRTVGRLNAQVAELQAEVARYAEQTREANGLREKQKALRAKLKVIEALDDKRVGPARVLLELSGATPAKLWIEEFTEEQGMATLIGWALDNQTVAVFMRQLESSPYFYDVDLAEATQPVNPGEQPKAVRRNGNAVRLKRFVIKAAVDYFGKGGHAGEHDGQQQVGA